MSAVKRGPGRPAIGAPIEVRLTDDMLAGVDAAAEADETTRPEWLRRRITHAVRVSERVHQPYPEVEGDDDSILQLDRSRRQDMAEALRLAEDMVEQLGRIIEQDAGAESAVPVHERVDRVVDGAEWISVAMRRRVAQS